MAEMAIEYAMPTRQDDDDEADRAGDRAIPAGTGAGDVDPDRAAGEAVERRRPKHNEDERHRARNITQDAESGQRRAIAQLAGVVAIERRHCGEFGEQDRESVRPAHPASPLDHRPSEHGHRVGGEKRRNRPGAVGRVIGQLEPEVGEDRSDGGPEGRSCVMSSSSLIGSPVTRERIHAPASANGENGLNARHTSPNRNDTICSPTQNQMRKASPAMLTAPLMLPNQPSPQDHAEEEDANALVITSTPGTRRP